MNRNEPINKLSFAVLSLHYSQTLEEALNEEQSKHTETKAALERVLCAKDEQVADLKEANGKLQEEIQKLESRPRASELRRSDRFKVNVHRFSIYFVVWGFEILFCEVAFASLSRDLFVTHRCLQVH